MDCLWVCKNGGLPLGSRIQEFKIADQKTTGEDEILLKARPPRGFDV